MNEKNYRLSVPFLDTRFFKMMIRRVKRSKTFNGMKERIRRHRVTWFL